MIQIEHFGTHLVHCWNVQEKYVKWKILRKIFWKNLLGFDQFNILRRKIWYHFLHKYVYLQIFFYKLGRKSLIRKLVKIPPSKNDLDNLSQRPQLCHHEHCSQFTKCLIPPPQKNKTFTSTIVYVIINKYFYYFTMTQSV